MFASPTSAKLQEIGPRFTLKLRWMKRGLPGVTAADGRIPGGAGNDGAESVDGGDEEGDEQVAEDEAMEEMTSGIQAEKKGKVSRAEMGIPPLDEEQEYEWKWKVRY